MTIGFVKTKVSFHLRGAIREVESSWKFRSGTELKTANMGRALDFFFWGRLWSKQQMKAQGMSFKYF